MLAEFDPEAELEVRTRYLPHWRQPGTTYFVTYRLADSLPADKARYLADLRRRWCASNAPPRTTEAVGAYRRLMTEKIEELLGAGYGECWLRRPEIAAIVAGAFQYFDGQRYRLGDFVVMPNHVHVLVTPATDWELSALVHSWKSYTAKEINRLLGRTGVLWLDEYYDHIVRDQAEWEIYRRYIELNPAKAGLKPGKYVYWRAPD